MKETKPKTIEKIKCILCDRIFWRDIGSVETVCVQCIDRILWQTRHDLKGSTEATSEATTSQHQKKIKKKCLSCPTNIYRVEGSKDLLCYKCRDAYLKEVRNDMKNKAIHLLPKHNETTSAQNAITTITQDQSDVFDQFSFMNDIQNGISNQNTSVNAANLSFETAPVTFNHYSSSITRLNNDSDTFSSSQNRNLQNKSLLHTPLQDYSQNLAHNQAERSSISALQQDSSDRLAQDSSYKYVHLDDDVIILLPDNSINDDHQNSPHTQSASYSLTITNSCISTAKDATFPNLPHSSFTSLPEISFNNDQQALSSAITLDTILQSSSDTRQQDTLSDLAPNNYSNVLSQNIYHAPHDTSKITHSSFNSNRKSRTSARHAPYSIKCSSTNFQQNTPNELPHSSTDAFQLSYQVEPTYNLQQCSTNDNQSIPFRMPPSHSDTLLTSLSNASWQNTQKIASHSLTDVYGNTQLQNDLSDLNFDQVGIDFNATNADVQPNEQTDQCEDYSDLFNNSDWC